MSYHDTDHDYSDYATESEKAWSVSSVESLEPQPGDSVPNLDLDPVSSLFIPQFHHQVLGPANAPQLTKPAKTRLLQQRLTNCNSPTARRRLRPQRQAREPRFHRRLLRPPVQAQHLARRKAPSWVVHTKHAAELWAATTALNHVRKVIRPQREKMVRYEDRRATEESMRQAWQFLLVMGTDSSYVVDGLTKHRKQWARCPERGGLITTDKRGEEVEDGELFTALEYAIDSLSSVGVQVQWYLVPSAFNKNAETFADAALLMKDTSKKRSEYFCDDEFDPTDMEDATMYTGADYCRVSM